MVFTDLHFLVFYDSTSCTERNAEIAHEEGICGHPDSITDKAFIRISNEYLQRCALGVLPDKFEWLAQDEIDSLVTYEDLLNDDTSAPEGEGWFPYLDEEL